MYIYDTIIQFIETKQCKIHNKPKWDHHNLWKKKSKKKEECAQIKSSEKLLSNQFIWLDFPN